MFFSESDSEDKAKSEWTKAFLENNITQIEQVKVGLRKVRKDPSPYFPSCGQFISWCQPGPEDFGLPMVHTAYNEACQNASSSTNAVWSHNAVYAAARATGWFELRSRTEKEVFPLFKRNYEIACRKVMAGEEIVIHKALPGTRQKTLAEKSEEINAKALAEKVEQQGLTGLKGKDALSRMRSMIV
ncbi:replication protein P [Zooshikella ganghwensis]|uniref:replication protein P n=1 Tax=Zooshikella ganghwensis TaxID=202772 RepID=UPI0009FBC1F0|nr:replication protein P [Zooshikella ganghwensis]